MASGRNRFSIDSAEAIVLREEDSEALTETTQLPIFELLSDGHYWAQSAIRDGRFHLVGYIDEFDAAETSEITVAIYTSSDDEGSDDQQHGSYPVRGPGQFSIVIDQFAMKAQDPNARYWFAGVNIVPGPVGQDDGEYAEATLTPDDQGGGSGLPANGETVIIGAKTYTYQTVLTNVDGNVAIGADIEETLANLAAAINLDEGAGTAYAAATTANTQVSAVSDETALTVTALLPGEDANAISVGGTYPDSDDADWGSETLEGGVDETTEPDEVSIKLWAMLVPQESYLA